MLNLPENAKLVYQGQRSRIYQWPQKLYDGTTATFEAIERLSSATVFATLDGKIVLQKQEQPHIAKPFYCCPGGMADEWDEEPLALAKRELLEETGLVSDDWEPWKLLGTKDYIHWKNQYFVARNCRKVAEPNLDPGEKIEVSTVTLDELLEMTENTDFRNRDLLLYFNRMKLHPEEKEKFKKFLFG